jgi:hypothetical membrane protein
VDARRTTVPRRWAAACGIAGPVAFVLGWLVNGLRTGGYDPLTDAISQLAREGAPTRTSMTLAFVAFGVLVPLWAGTLARELGAPALRPVVSTAGLATLAVAAIPLSRDPGGAQDLLHAVAAGTGYVAMALTPLVAAAALRRSGHRAAAAASVAVGLVAGCALVATLLADGSGGFQRLGLTAVDAWHVAAAVWVLRRT